MSMQKNHALTTGKSLSRLAYTQMKPVLSARREEVLHALKRLGRPSTGNEVAAELGRNVKMDSSNCRARLLELLEAGLVRVEGIVCDPATGRRVRAYIAVETV